jgi:hypothetical protein
MNATSSRKNYLIVIYLLLRSVLKSYSTEYLGYHLTDERFQSIKDTLNCWNENGKWIYDKSPLEKSFRSLSPCFSYYNDRDGCSEVLKGEQTDYRWDVPLEACKYPLKSAMQTNHLCAILKENANILFVGDSLTDEFRITFLNHGLRNSTKGPACGICNARNRAICENKIFCDGGIIKVYFVRNDFLTIYEDDVPHDFITFEKTWAHKYLTPLNISLLILNKGAHWRNDSIFESQLNETFFFLQNRHPNLSVIYRSSHAGHLNHKESFYRPPLNDLPPLPMDHFHWETFNYQNNIAKNMIAKHYPNVVFLDIYRSTMLRPDSHMDGLHYCIPGPVDNWVVLLYNLLFLISQQHDTDGNNLR